MLKIYIAGNDQQDIICYIFDVALISGSAATS